MLIKTDDPAVNLEIINPIDVEKLIGRECHNLRAYGANGDGSANDLSKILEACGDAKLSGGYVYVPRPSVSWKIDGILDFIDFTEVEIIGCGGSEARHPPRCPFEFVGDYPHLMKIGGTSLATGLKIRGIDFRLSNPTFDGDLLVIADGACFTEIDWCSFGYMNYDYAALPNARSAINNPYSVSTFIHNCFFADFIYHIIGMIDDGNTSTDLLIESCRFIESVKGAVLNPDVNWKINRNVFEYGFPASGGISTTNGGLTGGIVCGREGRAGTDTGLQVEQNGFWDVGGPGVWIDWLGNGLNAINNFIQCGDQGKFIECSRGGSGVSVSGGFCAGGAGAKFVSITGSPVTDFDDDNTTVLYGGVQRLYTTSPSFVKRISKDVNVITAVKKIAAGPDIGVILAPSGGQGSGANCAPITGSKPEYGAVSFHQDGASAAHSRVMLVYYQGDMTSDLAKSVTVTASNGQTMDLGASGFYVDRSLGDIVPGGFYIRAANVGAGSFILEFKTGF